MTAEEILEFILKSVRAKGGSVLRGGVYRDEPIIRTGRQLFGSNGGSASGKGSSSGQRSTRSSRGTTSSSASQSGQSSIWQLGQSLSSIVAETSPRVPRRIAEMRSLAGGRSRWTRSGPDAQLFFEQARFMADYTDDHPFEGEFTKYYPTYEDMSLAQLRGYFTWRTRWRAGEQPPAPLSFVFVRVYEVLCGVGVGTSADGLAELCRLRDVYGALPGNEALVTYLAIWVPDYITYHGLDRSALGRDAEGTPLERACAVLDAAERALLASKTPGTWDPSLPGIPSAEDLTFALAAASRYRIERSRVFADAFDELGECCCAVFARMVDHCHRRRKHGFVDSLFGEALGEPYTMYRSAVFFEPTAHPDAEVKLKSGVVFRCRLGRWTKYRPHASDNTSVELGDILHETDRVLRVQMGGFPELKGRDVPKYKKSIIEDVVVSRLARRAAEEAARVRIDRSALRSIRDASVRTREALLVDEEREEADVPPRQFSSDYGLTIQVAEDDAGKQEALFEDAFDGATQSDATQPDGETSIPGLSSDDVAFLRALLDGTLNMSELQSRGVMVSLVADRINEVFLDIVGDIVIEFDGDVPRIVEDYENDVREALS